MVPLMTKSITIQYMSSSQETYLSPVHTFQRAPWPALKKVLGFLIWDTGHYYLCCLAFR